ncbi:MAG: maleylpyruvate isomerase N-terminal domain-containing protein [Pseudonocardiaceae bacterium]
MTRLSYERYCAEIVTQTDLLRSCIKGADLTVSVPSCPSWNLGQLLRHLGGAQRWAETIVRTRAMQPPSDTEFRWSFTGANPPTARASRSSVMNNCSTSGWNGSALGDR